VTLSVAVTSALGDRLVDRSDRGSRVRAQHQGLRIIGDQAFAETRRPRVPGQLMIRWERQDVVWIMWLSGCLDHATVTLLDHEVDGRAVGSVGLVVDVTGLEFIDSPGLDALVGIDWRAAKRGDRVTFRHEQNVARRPVELTRIARLRSRWAAAGEVTNDTFYFALAMACVDVDHPRSDDRPEAA
jgi:anti-anti-sigma factor